jgi:dUTPase
MSKRLQTDPKNIFSSFRQSVVADLADGVKWNAPAHKGDVGYDLRAVSEPKIVGDLAYTDPSINERLEKEFGLKIWSRVDYVEYRTGIKIFSPSLEVASLIFPRSSISKKSLVLANSIGLCDPGYQGEFIVRFKYIPQPNDFILLDTLVSEDRLSQGRLGIVVRPENIYQQGDAIAQIVFYSPVHPSVLFSDFEGFSTDRGEGAFGSTDKK